MGLTQDSRETISPSWLKNVSPKKLEEMDQQKKKKKNTPKDTQF